MKKPCHDRKIFKNQLRSWIGGGYINVLSHEYTDKLDPNRPGINRKLLAYTLRYYQQRKATRHES